MTGRPKRDVVGSGNTSDSGLSRRAGAATILYVADRDARTLGLEQLLARIRSLRTHERDLAPFSDAWYAALTEEAAVIAELRAITGIAPDRPHTVEWLVAQP